MIRLIKRYESRKLYDTEESRYVSLDELGEFVREGQELKVIDNATGEDVTGPTLTQVILEAGRSGRSALSTDFLHDLVRRGERALSTGVEQVQQGVDRLMQASLEKVGPLRHVRDEMETLRGRLEELEASLANLEEPAAPKTKSANRKYRRRPAKKTAAKKTTTKKTASKKSAVKKTATKKRAAKKSTTKKAAARKRG